MARIIFLAPVAGKVNLSNATENLVKTLEQQGKSVGFFKAVEDVKSTRKTTAPTLSLDQVEDFISNQQYDVLLETLVANVQAVKNVNDFVVVEGVLPSCLITYANSLNFKVAQTLGAEIVLVTTAAHQALVDVIANDFGGLNNKKILGRITDSTLDDALMSELSKAWQETGEHSPAAFRYQLTELAKAANKTIVLPEGDEPRTVKAASICAKRGIAQCVLLADPKSVEKVALEQGITLGDGVTIIDPASIRDNYVNRLVELRKAKGMTEAIAQEQLQDTVVLGTMMLENNEVDGLVSGAVHTTANTIRPPMQIIKTAPGSSIVSSIFFMLMPEQVYVYGDCAVNPNPTAEQLAQIAIQSADSAKAFGIEPRVAMISYSTGTSGSGADVEKVALATKLAKVARPDLLIDGPLQYDAAVMEDVARSKAPNSPVAGKATVFIFPDLNTGNTTYKAVQRSANVVSIGPMLQGMRKPVNDLSRGALVDDIIYTIALTAIQATQ